MSDEAVETAAKALQHAAGPRWTAFPWRLLARAALEAAESLMHEELRAENERLRAENQQMRNTRTLHPSQWTCPYVSDDGDGALWCEMRKGHDGPHTWERAALDTGRDS